MADQTPRIGIGVITRNRLPYLRQALHQISLTSSVPYDLVIADDESSDGTLQWARNQQVAIVTGSRRGVSWNKNRALLYLAMFSDCDIMILMEDDMWPVEAGWDLVWASAAERWQHVNFVRPTYADQEASSVIGQGTVDDPFQAAIFGGQCTAITRDALAHVGYLDTQFRGYGYGHVEWSNRFRTAFGSSLPFPDGRSPCLNFGLGEAWTVRRSFNSADADRNRLIFEKLAEAAESLRFLPPWRSDTERLVLLQEVTSAHERQSTASSASHLQYSQQPDQGSLAETSPSTVSFVLFTDQLIAFRHYLHAVFHLRPLVPVHSANLVVRDATIPLSPSYKSDHVVLEGYGLIDSIADVENAEVDLRTAAGAFSCGDLVTKDLHRIDPFNRSLAKFVTRVRSDQFDVLEIGSRQRLATVFDPDFRSSARFYTGIDILDGPNVDVVCDAHELASHVGTSCYDIVYSQYVFEHLAMPWVAIAEINKVLRLQGECFIATNQSIGLHDLPWDFWRFSESAWHALFNEDTGFELVACGLGEPVHLTPRRYHSGFREHEGGVGFQASFAWARKISEKAPHWPVAPERVFARLSRAYPREITD